MVASKDEYTRSVAVQAFGNLATQCSDPGAVEKTVTSLFKVLGGWLKSFKNFFVIF